ncbi:putative riboflavin synthase, alpha chain [Clavulina sp. PMI_390]|nr:putative riboflavin synthase, alpha chain [Clavulina sp. PMI_390]
MFTGLIERMGVVSKIVPMDETVSGGGGWSITISDAAPILDDCHIGDSICCNGVCLTVTEFTADSFKVGVAPESLDRSNLGDLKEGSKINLERAMAAHVRFGGHMVQGHVDDTVKIFSRQIDGNSLRLTFQAPEPTPTRPSLMPYIIMKGYVTLDGASLTITTIDDVARTFGVMLIAHTQASIDLANKQVGERVNVEVDMVGKYVEKSVIAALGGTSSGILQAQIESAVERVLARKQ